MLEADYLVVGAGAAGMAFTDALIENADVSVVMVDRRHSVGGHWLDAYPFVRLHQASAFYGVASTLLGQGRTQQMASGSTPRSSSQMHASVAVLPEPTTTYCEGAWSSATRSLTATTRTSSELPNGAGVLAGISGA